MAARLASPARYSTGAIVLHWLIAALLGFQIIFADTLEGPSSPELFARFQLHKSVGITVLLLSLARLGWRLVAPRPASAPGPGWAKALANAVHVGFYVVIIGAPIAGWIIVSSAKIEVPTLLFGTLPWPHLPVPKAWHDGAETVHGLLANIGIGLFALHIAGALRHQWLVGRPLLARMLPFGEGRGGGALAIAVLIIGSAMAAGALVNPYTPKAQPAPAAPAEPAEAEALPAIADPPAPPEATDTKPPDADTAEPAETANAPPAEPRVWQVAPGGTLGFTARWNDEPINGRFARWSAEIRLSPDALDASTIRVRIDLSSVSTGDGQRDSALAGSDFFDTARFASAEYRADRFRALGGNRYAADGTLSLRGVSRPVPLRFTLDIDGDRAHARGTARIDRTSFGVGQGEFAGTDSIPAAVDIAFDFRASAAR